MLSDAIESSNMVYSYIGQRIKERRKVLQLNQTKLAEMMGFSYQQVQKYETGASHITAGKLLRFAKVLNVPPAYFYEGINLDEGIGKSIETDLIQKVRTEPLRILHVEDNPADVILFNKALASCSEPVNVYSIHSADMVMDYLQHCEGKFRQSRPDIVVFDLSIQKISGLELLKSIKKNPKTLTLPIVILTNSISSKKMVEAYKYGAAGFIQKSLDVTEYVHSLDVMIQYWSKVVSLPA